MASLALLRRYKWFRGRTGAVGRDAAASLNLARADAWKDQEERAGRLRVRWEYDWEGKLEWYCQCGCEPSEVLGCVVETRTDAHADECEHGSPEDCECKHWEHAASLWGIGDPDRAYRCMVEAELCLEMMPN